MLHTNVEVAKEQVPLELQNTGDSPFSVLTLVDWPFCALGLVTIWACAFTQRTRERLRQYSKVNKYLGWAGMPTGVVSGL